MSDKAQNAVQKWCPSISAFLATWLQVMEDESLIMGHGPSHTAALLPRRLDPLAHRLRRLYQQHRGHPLNSFIARTVLFCRAVTVLILLPPRTFPSLLPHCRQYAAAGAGHAYVLRDRNYQHDVGTPPHQYRQSEWCLTVLIPRRSAGSTGELFQGVKHSP